MPLLPTPAQSRNNPDAQAKLCSYVDGLVNECSQRMTALDLPTTIERNVNLFLGSANQLIQYKGRKYPVNRIVLVCLANAAVQVGDRPKIQYSARESGEPGRFYLNTQLEPTPATEPLLSQIDAVGPQYRQAIGGQFPQPLPQALVQLIKAQIAIGKQVSAAAQAQGMPAPDVVPEELLIEINDRTTAEALQDVADAKLEECGFGQSIVENVLYNNICGYQHMLFEWDDEKKLPIFTNPHPAQVFQDPMKTDVQRAQFVIFDQFLGREEALSLFPHLAEDIDRWATAGPPQVAGTTPYRLPTQFTQQAYFYRETLILRTAWLRNQPYPLTEEEALASGKVQKVQRAPAPAPEPSAEVVPQESGGLGGFRGLMGKLAGMFGGEDPSPEHEQAETPAEEATEHATGEEAAEPAELATVFVLTANGEETTPESPNWPTRTSIRQVRIIVGHVVDDRECEFVDIPMLHNVNIPIMWTPYGQGEPERLAPLQAALNATVGDMIEHGEYNAFPTQLVPESVAEKIPTGLQNAYIKPGHRLTIPDALYLKFAGQPISTLNPPQQSAEVYKRLEILLSLFDTESDQSKVLTGQASATWSGDAIGRLQQAAKTTILFKSGRTEDLLRHLARLLAGAIVYRMTPEDLADGFRKYPIHVWYDLHNRMKTLSFDVAVAITSGSGANKQAQVQNMIVSRQQGIEVSQATIIEALDLDPKVEATKNAQWERDKAAALASGPQPVQPGGQPGMANPNMQQEQPPAMPPAAS